jgi:peptidoglycan/xylan/chitin deacetylase (PgdA/CDA1 family)
MPRGLILLYHRVAEVQSDPWSLSVTPDRFADHLQVLREVGQPMALDELSQNLRDGKCPYRPLVVTFDDGYADNLYTAKPLLERCDIPATVFVSAGLVDGNRQFWWDELDQLLQGEALPKTLDLNINGNLYHWTLGEPELCGKGDVQQDRQWKAWDKHKPNSRQSLYLAIYKLLQPLKSSEQAHVLSQLMAWASPKSTRRASSRPLTNEEIVALKGGLIDIGAHTMTHPLLSARPTAIQREEIQQSKAYLEGILGSPVTSFAYPYGGKSAYTAETVALVREAGFGCACSTLASVVSRSSHLFRLPRLHVENWDSERFSRTLSGWLNG